MTDVGARVAKTRNRVPISCSVCRRRKMKCDKAKPHCGGCIRNQTEAQCKYNDQPWTYLSNKMQLSNEVIRLKMKINKLEKVIAANNLSVDDSLENDNFTPISSDGSSPEVDPAIELSEKFDTLVIKENKVMHFGSTSFMAISSSDTALAQIFSKYGQKHLERYQDYLRLTQRLYLPGENTSQSLQEERRLVYDDVDFCLERVTDPSAIIPQQNGSASKVEEYLTSLNQILPQLSSMNALVDHFFRKAYLMFPFLDEHTFKKDVSLVLFEGSDGRGFLRVVHMCNLCTVPLLLLVLRISYMSLSVSDYDMQTSSVQDVRLARMVRSGLAIGPEFVEFAKHCVLITPSDDNVMRKITLKNIQVLLYLRLYRLHSPEDIDESFDSTIILSMLIQMVRMHGLYRDPSNFTTILQDERMHVIWRRIFYKILSLDAAQSLHFGCPLSFEEENWDTKLPELSKDEQDVYEAYVTGAQVSSTPKLRAVIMDHQVNKDIALEWEAAKLMRRSLKITLSIRRAPKKSQLTNCIREIEFFLEKKLPSFAEMLDGKGFAPNPGRYAREIPSNMIAFFVRLNLSVLVYLLTYLLYISYESDKEVQEEYAIKTLEKSLIIFKVAIAFMEYVNTDELSCIDIDKFDLQKAFYSGFEKFLSSTILISGLRALQFVFSVNLRFQDKCFCYDNLVRNFGNSADTLSVLTWFNQEILDVDTNNTVDDNFNLLLFHYLKLFYSLCRTMQESLTHCWRICMIFKLFFNHLKKNYPEKFNEMNRRYDIVHMKYKSIHSTSSPETFKKASPSSGYKMEPTEVPPTDGPKTSSSGSLEYEVFQTDDIGDVGFNADDDEFFKQLFSEADLFNQNGYGYFDFTALDQQKTKRVKRDVGPAVAIDPSLRDSGLLSRQENASENTVENTINPFETVPGGTPSQPSDLSIFGMDGMLRGVFSPESVIRPTPADSSESNGRPSASTMTSTSTSNYSPENPTGTTFVTETELKDANDVQIQSPSDGFQFSFMGSYT
ncbi:unnamed protein product [Kuraishia capsulata CBS 1993]|uniref:Zn(2)-C6 fungal-type domain-containing protein n=1 Tax=Kuraishia capsulata CBS 1993 TaxID=1382522 RepID=W6MXR6_9ASCO|nr:uncharacterized protein KUCA_T00005343001 [Kuraishia capsulata CBS 1993]CDK29355.1 unnamed protein product [Kuraishia capsulata CBS 1993]